MIIKYYPCIVLYQICTGFTILTYTVVIQICVDFAYTGANNLCSTNNPTNFNAKKATLFGRPDTHFNIHLIS